ncbi:MAG TPA: hypothetical protein VFX96_10780, partial [Pyrinomonadaceae bacterium]|nr:hypothetical protein [Pyrinomonadaceae bacterium]
MRLLVALMLLTLPAGCAARDSHAGASEPANAEATPQSQKAHATPTPYRTYIPDDFGQLQGDIEYVPFTEDATLVRGEYRLVKHSKDIKVDHVELTIEYAELLRGEKVLATFGADSGEPHSPIEFGAFDFLGVGGEQLVVEQTANKVWRYWVIELSPRPRVIYDSTKYNAVLPLRVADFDGDGRREIIQNIGTFWYFDWFSNLDSPRPPVIFAYDEAAQRYVPASAKFSEVTLADIEGRIAKVRELKERGDVGGHRAGVIDVVARYVYSGREREAWAFFEQECGDCRVATG